MNIKAMIKQTFSSACAYFTVLTAIYTVLMMIVNVSADEILMSAEQVLLIFIFSVIAGMARSLFRIPRMATVGKLLLHYLALGLAFYFCFLLPSMMTPAQVFIGLVLFSVLYFAVMGVVALFRSRLKANLQKDEPYENKFKKTK